MKVNLGKQKRARIEMLPLIDIVFLLLVFFIYAMLSMVVNRGISVNLPVSSTAKTEKGLPLSVVIKENGDILLDGHNILLKDLSALLKLRTDKGEHPGLFLSSDKKVSCQRLINVMDRIREAGISRISLQTNKENNP
ncbi:MAG: biopolymer transporter ExbD [Thermodesulfobacteriota bacterium]|nr:biopolymer transporter ExbD [Thermodesulfobacteriota bacterium]